MRQKVKSNGVIVNAVAGTHVVLLGFNMDETKRKGCLGFAIQREDHTEDERYWMSGMKTFEDNKNDAAEGGNVSSQKHPFQSFQWSDYSAKPNHDYTYKLIPLYGKPLNLIEGDPVIARVQTESEFGNKHCIFFNRGALASQEYARRFLNKSPEDIGDAAFNWLSRGLIEGLLSFIDRAKGQQYGLYCSIYELQLEIVLRALKKASDNGAKVEIIYDALPKANGPKEKNEEAISNVQIKSLCIERTIGTIMHNKFLILTKNDIPIAVWTGSTNLTENGVYGHSNLGHIIEDESVAKKYKNYWDQLRGDPETKDIKAWIEENNSTPSAPWNKDEIEVFSPRKGLDVLDWYAEIARNSQKALFISLAFGMHKKFQEVFENDDGILRVALMEKEGNGKGLEQGKIDIRRIRALPNVIVAIGNNLKMNCFDRWLSERQKYSAETHVKFIHTKYMLIDPLGETPIVVTGSANFSEASTNKNDENMMVIRNNKRVADIYLGEFMRLYSHYAFREAVAISKEKKETGWKPQFLSPTDIWQKDYYQAGHQRFLRRNYFCGE